MTHPIRQQLNPTPLSRQPEHSPKTKEEKEINV